jgi:sterol desaturase/sphingolipid hydroxylase (fatty acid hydroxylase superfamily)
MNEFYAWLTFWGTYIIIGLLTDDLSHLILLPNFTITNRKLITVITINIIISFLLIPIINKIPTLIYLPDTFFGYILRWCLSFIISDCWLYITHRLFHSPMLYKYHKMHHIFVNPHKLAGLYVYPIEFILSNHLSMMIPLKIISNQNLIFAETAFVALDILMSHAGKDYNHPSASYHGIHHQYMNYNFGFLYVSDILFGTYKSK